MDFTYEPINSIFARDIGVGADGTMWHIGRKEEADGYEIYRLKNGATNWEKIAGSGVAIAVGPDGNAWIVTRSKKLLRYNGNDWDQFASYAKDVSVAADGNVYFVGANSYMWMLNSDKKTWKSIPGMAVKIVGGPNQNRWHINSAGNIYKKKDAGWVQVKSDGPKAADIAIGANGRVAIITNDSYVNDQTLAFWNEAGESWVYVPVTSLTLDKTLAPGSALAAASRIDVDPTGAILGVRSDLSVFKVSYTP